MAISSIFESIKTRRLEKRIDWHYDFPRHIAIMMDGNGRWGKRRGLSRSAGHYAGMNTMKETIRDCRNMNIRYLTLYAFSTENWKRPQQEVDYIISLVQEFVDDQLIEEMNRNEASVQFIGDLQRFPENTRRLMARADASTSSNKGMTVNFVMNYGGRSEIVHAVRTAIAAGNVKELNEEEFEQYLYTSACPSPELIIRTSGEKRLSGFLLWQSAQAEIWFTDVMWPSFNRHLLLEAIIDYQQRKVR